MVEIMRDDATLAIYSTDNSIYQVRPAAVALPSSADQIAQLLAENHRSAQPKPLVARGGGTGTNGQSLTNGLVVDVKRNLNNIISIDPERLEAVVEPGVVTAQLNAELAKHGLFWAPHTSTLNRATVGGMISTDAAGKGSLVHGRAHRHVLSLEVLMADGTAFTAEPTPVAEAQRLAADPDDPAGPLWRALLDLPIEEGVDFGFPELARGFSGYGIDRLRRGDMIDPIALICGAEGTLAVITRATIRLTKLPTTTVLLVASYDSFGEALEDAVELRNSGPTAIESFDETTLERGRSSPAWPALGAVVGEHRGSVLLLEYSSSEPNSTAESDSPIDLAAAEAALAATGRSRAVKALIDPADQAAAWKVRADAVGLLAKVATGGPERSARPTAFVEDCAVPVAAMSEFIAGFRATLDQAGVSYGMFGHADVGCVHVRPALDLTDPEHETMVRSITDSVVDLLQQHGGVLWGEHGRGFRGDSVEKFLRPETIDIMKQVKAAFDPKDLLNPGKLYRPAGTAEAIVAVDEPPLRGQADRQVPVSVRRHFDSAFACNGNGLCHHYGGAEVMCPSYKVSGDPALSPRGRADLLRAWLNGRSTRSGDDPNTGLEEAIASNLHQCLSCSACSGRCPVEVDIPEMKSRFLEQYYENRRRPASHALLSRFEQLAALAARAPRLAGFGSKPAGQALGLVDLPAPKPFKPAAGSSRGLTKFDPSDPTVDPEIDVVIMPDVFTSALEPATLHKSVAVLEAIGLSVTVASFVPSGKFDHVKGKRAAFRKAAAAQDKMVRSILNAGAQPVVIEPAIALLHRSEYKHIAPDGQGGGTGEGTGDRVRHLVEVLDENRSRIPKAANPQTLNLLNHCTEQATAPHVVAAWQRVLTAAGHTVNTPSVGCCGMAGIFGHEVGNQAMSRQLWDLTWDAPVADDQAIPVATGYSCRSQAGRFGEQTVLHPIAML
ncbi:MAG: FAD-binding and (Fe-S)-binding domain-containing protein [Acidimicrobiales bacterium]